MAQPEFNSEERYIIAFYKRNRNFSDWGNWLIHGLMIALFAYGLFKGDQALLFTAFGVVMILQVYLWSFQPRFFQSTKSVIEKYEAKISELERRGGEEG